MLNWLTLCYLFLILLASGFARLGAEPAVTEVRGTVFADRNGNGTREIDESGVADVLVSNGREVALTDAEGAYQLPIRARAAIFVVKPAHFAFPRDGRNLPDFYRLHWPEGSELLRYGGVPATGELPASVDFALLLQEPSSTFQVLVVADPQVHNVAHVGYYDRRFINELSGRRDFAFGVMLGDIVRNDLSLFDPYIAVNARLPGPIFHVVGNHDVDYDATDETAAVATYNRHFGPANYALMEGETVFIVLNNVRSPLPDHAEAGGEYVGGFTSDALAFVENLLRYVPQERLIVLCQHIPLISGNDRPEVFRPADQSRLLGLLSARPVLALAGHTHMQRHTFLGPESGWPGATALQQWIVGTASGSWWGGSPAADGLPESTMRDGTPPGYGILHIEGTRYRAEYRVPGQSPEHQMRVMTPRHVIAGERDQPILVNVFNGSERTVVEYRMLPGDKWIKLPFIPGVDYEYAGKTWVRDSSEELQPGTRLPPVEMSYHLWRGRLPRSLPVGRYEIEVRVRDEWGGQFMQQRPLQVHPATLPYGRN